MNKSETNVPDVFADDTPQQQRGVPFKPGLSGNPSGRPKGSRSKLSEEFLTALYQDFEVHGSEVIQKVRSDKPDAYLKIVANLMPARLEAILDAKVDVNVAFNDTNSVEDILELVAQEAGVDAAQTLAQMFGIEVPDATEQTLLPPLVSCPHTGTTYKASGGKRFPYQNCQCEACRDWRESYRGGQ